MKGGSSNFLNVCEQVIGQKSMFTVEICSKKTSNCIWVISNSVRNQIRLTSRQTSGTKKEHVGKQQHGAKKGKELK